MCEPINPAPPVTSTFKSVSRHGQWTWRSFGVALCLTRLDLALTTARRIVPPGINRLSGQPTGFQLGPRGVEVVRRFPAAHPFHQVGHPISERDAWLVAPFGAD